MSENHNADYLLRSTRDGDGVSEILTGDGTTLDKRHPNIEVAAMILANKLANGGKMDDEYDEMVELDYGPCIDFSDRELKDLCGYEVGDKICMSIEVEVKSFDHHEDSDREYNNFGLQIKKVKIESEVDDAIQGY